VLPGHFLRTINSNFFKKICVINVLEFVTFDFFKKYFLNLGSNVSGHSLTKP